MKKIRLKDATPIRRNYPVNCVDINEKKMCLDCYRGEDNKWYSSEEAWLKVKPDFVAKKHREKYWKLCIDFMADVLGYKERFPFPSLVTKRLKELENYGYDVVYDSMREHEDTLRYYVKNKEFESDLQRIGYLFAIVKSNLLSLYNNKEEREKRRNRNDISLNNLIDLDEKVEVRKHKVRDISKFLDEEDEDD